MLPQKQLTFPINSKQISFCIIGNIIQHDGRNSLLYHDFENLNMCQSTMSDMTCNNINKIIGSLLTFAECGIVFRMSK